MAVLVNANSYSAAEFFAAQLRESVGAPVIGEQTKRTSRASCIPASQSWRRSCNTW